MRLSVVAVHWSDKLNYKTRCLVAAVANGDAGLVEFLISRDPDLALYQIPGGGNSVSAAIDGAHLDVIRILLKTLPQLASHDAGAGQPLYQAARNGNERIIQLLLEAIPDVSSDERDAVLRILREEGHESTAKSLQLLMEASGSVAAVGESQMAGSTRSTAHDR